jgi:hypothetical protein
MTHQTAVKTVTGLLPQIEKEGVTAALLKHATTHDLPVAQLEKLAQVFNTLRTVAHVDHAPPGERARDVEIIDTPALLRKYATENPGMPSKAARIPSSYPSHDPDVLDLRLMFETEAFPEDSSWLKAAAEKPAAPPPEAKRDNPTREQVKEAAIEAEIEVRLELSKAAAALFDACPRGDNKLDLTDAEREACYLAPPEAVKAACDWFETYAAARRIAVWRHDHSTSLVKRAFAVESKLGRLVERVTTLHAEHAWLAKVADAGRMEELVGDTELYNWGRPGESDPFPTAPHGIPDADDEAARQEAERAMQELVAQAENENLQQSAQGGRMQRDDDEEQSGGGKGKGKGGKGGGNKDKEDADSVAARSKMTGDLFGAATAPAALAAREVIGAADKADEVLAEITAKSRDNKAQRNADMSVEDIKRSIHLRRMIGTDPVLREADQNEVLEIYNSIAQINPALADNMPALKLLLREAVNYEGLTLDSQKQLADIRKALSQSEKDERELDRQRYAVGGAAPISLNLKSKAI